MGNCVLKSLGGQNGPGSTSTTMVKVVTHSGGVMELYPPLTAECITNGFPGHALFRSANPGDPPLLHTEDLLSGQVYHLRPLNAAPCSLPSLVAPYRMSFDVHHHGLWKKQRHQQPQPQQQQQPDGVVGGWGAWRVKLVITPAQLTEILSQDAKTEALIESVRTVAKCRNASAASAANSDQWSLSSSRKGSGDSNANVAVGGS